MLHLQQLVVASESAGACKAGRFVLCVLPPAKHAWLYHAEGSR